LEHYLAGKRGYWVNRSGKRFSTRLKD
jgi:hypothetical protein